MKAMKPMRLNKALKNAKKLFYAGIIVAVIGSLMGFVLDGQLPDSGVSTAVVIVSGVAGIVVMLAGILYCWNAVRCPYCDASLMAGGRMPTSLPHFCPDCGKNLDSCG